jgi:hypothetical protein
VYSLCLSKGCRAGLRFLWSLLISDDEERVWSSVDREIVLTFY